jgi:hypothetical protein
VYGQGSNCGAAANSACARSPIQTPFTVDTFGLRGGAIVVDPRGQYVAIATRSQDGTNRVSHRNHNEFDNEFVTQFQNGSGVAVSHLSAEKRGAEGGAPSAIRYTNSELALIDGSRLSISQFR